ncbi:uncharacterized protein SPAPADRAFT_55769 [Spathaspora passalidarum NRRL Y-27907]|uniref:Kinesin-like protein n=1 Tax=Spathaspora passalidarum (strain NRRL Y-27907 / 11-Y1) TaxID=619300 RepID=G3APV6_SPAPN|nr:uncharacterized protein SPAPADRAFT_55769 [Spathaspora passalidarum NRRL Y-27907]EGW32277.1 hypothetical protein SPAPADRAFT_55769 [Spathaspora passalidarum NRRL Y-27907]
MTSSQGFAESQSPRLGSPGNRSTSSFTFHTPLSRTVNCSTNENNPIKVICRVRPENSWEARKGRSIVGFPNSETISIHGRDVTNTFTFDRVFDHNASQLDVYQYSISEIVDDVFNGYNGTVLAYGQTGAGKSYTMMGSPLDYNEKGIIPRISEEIFSRINNGSPDIEYTVAVSFMEIYMEQIKDLICIAHNDNPEYKFEIHEDKTNGIYVTGLSQQFANSEEDLLRILGEGIKYRSTSATNMNSESSRSHTIFELKLTQKHIETEVSKYSRLFLVDLAGSEKVDKTGSQGQTLQEAKKINLSLSALGNVINSLTDGKSTHVPYRDSKLTRILQESLGGNSRTSLIINCSPSSLNELETISTLRFGTRAKFIKNEAHVNTELSPAALKNKVNQLEKLNENNQAYIKQLEQELDHWRTNGNAHAAASTSPSSPGTQMVVRKSSMHSRLPVLSLASTMQTAVPNNDEVERRDRKIEELENIILNLKVQNLRSSHNEDSKMFALENSLHNISNKLNEVELININLRKHLLISEKIIESRDKKIQRLKMALKDQQMQISREALSFRNRLGEIQLRLEELNKHKQEELSVQKDLLMAERGRMATATPTAFANETPFTNDDVVTISDVDPDPSLIDSDDESNELSADESKETIGDSPESYEQETILDDSHSRSGRASIGVSSRASTTISKLSDYGFSIYSSKRLNSPRSEKTSITELESDIINYQHEYVSIGDFLKESRKKFSQYNPSLRSSSTIGEDNGGDTSSMADMFDEGPKQPKKHTQGFNLKIVKPMRSGSLGICLGVN